MDKRGRLSSEKIAYLVIIFVIGLMLFMGYGYLTNKDKEANNISSVSKAAISKDGNTVLKSIDGSAIVVVPKDAQANAEEISIQKIDNPLIDSEKRASGIYKFGPSGTVFDMPIELRIAYNQNVVGQCPSRINFYHFNDDNTLKEYVPAKSVYCDISIAVFEIDSFSQGYAGAAVRDEETLG